jgi:hypothetical protein
MKTDNLVNEVVTEGDQRREDRFAAVLPLEMEGVSGFTRDVSETGVYFETDALSEEIGPLVNFSLEYRQGGQVQKLQCEAKVVRVEARGDHVGIAAKLMEPLFAQPEAAT